jgi:hypothetical protein
MFVDCDVGRIQGEKSGEAEAFIRGSENPTGEGASWVKRFASSTVLSPRTKTPNTILRSGGRSELDNQYMDKDEYEQTLQMYDSEILKRAYIGGMVGGGVFCRVARPRWRSQSQTWPHWHVVNEMPRC